MLNLTKYTQSPATVSPPIHLLSMKLKVMPIFQPPQSHQGLALQSIAMSLSDTRKGYRDLLG